MSVFDEDKFLGKCIIKDGASIGQDFAWFRWPDRGNVRGGPHKLDIVFKAYQGPNKGSLDLKAKGFGIKGENNQYGNGSIFVHECDVEWISSKERYVPPWER